MELERQPTIEEMRRVARYMAETMGLHSAAGKLFAKADQLERLVDALMKVGPR
jgi:pantoate kinase